MFADVMANLIESSLRASVVLGAAWALTSAMRRAAAATRHFAWSCAIAGSILAAVIGGLGPRWIVALPSAFGSAAPAALSNAQPDLAPAWESTSTTTLAGPTAASSPAAVSRTRLDSTLVLVLLWAAGALSILAYALAGVLGASWIRRSAARLEAPWVDEAHVLAEAFEIRVPIAVVESKAVSMPMVCGMWRPLIVMPQSAAEWSDERRRIVILHELAHIKRRDCLTQTVAQIVCAVYWFNPIVWLAARRLRAERERACDDFVLAAGEKGADYAAHLLDIAQTIRHRRVPALVGLAMARPSQLEGRLLAILDPAIRRSSALQTRLASLGVMLFVTLPVGAVEFRSPASPVSAIEADPAAGALSLATFAPREPATPAPTPTSTPTPTTTSATESPEEVEFPGAVVDADRIATEIGNTLGAAAGRSVASPLSAQTAAATDPKTVEALIGALSDADPDVREMVVVTLGRMRDQRVVPALLPLLKDGNAEVREQVVFALARSGDPRATAAVATMIDDASPDVREQAVHMLGRSRNRDAVPALVKALQDSSADVREQAAFALGQIRDVSAVDPLLAMLKDSSPDVREQSAFALGQLRNGRAVDGLMAALKDSSADVREQAAFALGHVRDPKALPALTDALRDPVSDVREQAAFAIGQISGQQ
jgi:HEAT repeat protein/beta-lactamase regulating signal transducer with metallopeptidase domain